MTDDADRDAALPADLGTMNFLRRCGDLARDLAALDPISRDGVAAELDSIHPLSEERDRDGVLIGVTTSAALDAFWDRVRPEIEFAKDRAAREEFRDRMLRDIRDAVVGCARRGVHI